MVKHGWFQNDRGPEDLLGVVLKLAQADPRGMKRSGGVKFITPDYDFWPSMESYENGRMGFQERTKEDVEREGIVIHNSPQEAFDAAAKEET